MDKKTTAKNQSENHSSTCCEKTCSTSTQKNLQDIKNALEQIMSATSASSARNPSNMAIADAANIARLHSFASDAYAHLLGMMAKSN